MLLNIAPTLLDQMAEGIIVLNHQALVIHHNTAGKRWLTGRGVDGDTARPAGTPPHRAAAGAPSSAVSRDPVRTNSRMVMTRLILELYSGQLKLGFLPEPVVAETLLAAPIESFSVTLLTGLPSHERSRATCTQCPFSLQAPAYAQNIAELMAPG